MQPRKVTSSKAVNAAAVWLIWWPSLFFTLFSYYQYAKLYILLPYARGLGLSHSSELSNGQFLYVFSQTLFTGGVTIPLATFLAGYFVNLKITARLVLLGSLFLALLSYVSLMSVSTTGTLMSWELIHDSIIQGIEDPELAGHYVSTSSVIKLLIVLVSICILAFLAHHLQTIQLRQTLHKILGFMLFAPATILPSAYLYSQINTGSQIDPGVDFYKQQVVTLLQIGGETSSTFDGLDIDQAINLFQKTVNAPQRRYKDPYYKKEADSNLIIISLETGPQKVINFLSNEKFKNLRNLAKKSIVSEQHYSTYPYTSDALFSVLSSLYPNNLRRPILAQTAIDQENNIDAGRIGLFNVLRKFEYFVKVYLPIESVFTQDRLMFSMFGAEEIFIPSKEMTNEKKWKTLVENTVNNFPGYDFVSIKEKEEFERHLTNDFISLEKLLSDIKVMARSGTKFTSLFLPLSGHGPWPNQEPNRRLLETGMDVFLMQDEWIGRIVRTLEESGISDRTMIVVTADHGLRTSAEYPELKPGVLNEISFRVPLIIYAPNAVSNLTKIKSLTSHIDIMPSILSLLGINDHSVIMLGSPVWDERIAKRRTYFLANDYLGVDGYFEEGKFSMYQAMTNSTIVSDNMYSRNSTTPPTDSKPNRNILEDGREIASRITFQKSFQNVIKKNLLSSN